MSDREAAQGTGIITELEASSIVEDAYHLILKRAPDVDGLSNYVSRLVDGEISVIALVAELMASEEALAMEQQRANSTKAASPLAEAEACVVEAFECVLNRAPEEGAIASFSAALSSGNITLLGLVGELLRSEEFEHRAIFNLRVARLVAKIKLQWITGVTPDDLAVDLFAHRLRAEARRV